MRRIILGLASGVVSFAAAAQGTAYSSEYVPPPSFDSFAIPAEVPAPYSGDVSPRTPAFREISQGDVEQRRTAELLAAEQRYNARALSFDTPSNVTVTQRSYVQEPPQLTTMALSSARAYSLAASSATSLPPAAPVYSTTYPDSGMNMGDAGTAAIPPMPNARPGECFALVRQPEQYRTVEKSYVARPAYDRVDVTPPRYETTAQEVVTQEAYEQLEISPASFRTVTERIEVRPPSVRYIPIEPQYATETERIMERPARQVWKRGNGPIERLDNATGQIMCLVEEPPVYKTVTRRVLKREADVREVPIPGEYRTITRRVVDRPADLRRIVIPEQRNRINLTRLAEPAASRRVRVPEEVATTTVRELAAPSILEWRPVLCETNTTPDVIRRVQEALRREGFDPGVNDGRLGGGTIAALNAYQRSRNLPVDNYLNVETVRSLGIGY